MIHIGESFHLVVDKTAIHLPDKFENAFDVFLKSFFVFNVKYPLFLSNFFNFLEVKYDQSVLVYKLNKNSSLLILPKFDSNEFRTLLSALWLAKPYQQKKNPNI
jgi:hypothetical protein